MDGDVCHSHRHFAAHINGVFATIAQAEFDKHISCAHYAKANLPPISYAVALFLKWMQRQAFIKHGIQRTDGNTNGPVEATPIKLAILTNKFGKVDGAEKATPSCRERFFLCVITEAFYPLLLELSLILYNFQHIAKILLSIQTSPAYILSGDNIFEFL